MPIFIVHFIILLKADSCFLFSYNNIISSLSKLIDTLEIKKNLIWNLNSIKIIILNGLMNCNIVMVSQYHIKDKDVNPD